MRPGGGFVPNFLLFEKGDVNGENEQKVFTFLKVSEHKSGMDWSGRDALKAVGLMSRTAVGLLEKRCSDKFKNHGNISCEALALSRGHS